MTATGFYDGIIPVRLIAEYNICPTQAWLRIKAQPVSWNVDHWKPGEERDPPEELVRAAARAILGGPEAIIVYRPLLVDEKLGLAGAPDVVALGRRGVDLVVEYKENPPRNPEPWLLQAAAYKILYEEVHGRRAEAVLLTPAGASRATPAHMARVFLLVHRLRRLLSRPDPPPPRLKPPCGSCNYRRICPYSRRGGSRLVGVGSV